MGRKKKGGGAGGGGANPPQPEEEGQSGPQQQQPQRQQQPQGQQQPQRQQQPQGQQQPQRQQQPQGQQQPQRQQQPQGQQQPQRQQQPQGQQQPPRQQQPQGQQQPQRQQQAPKQQQPQQQKAPWGPQAPQVSAPQTAPPPVQSAWGAQAARQQGPIPSSAPAGGQGTRPGPSQGQEAGKKAPLADKPKQDSQGKKPDSKGDARGAGSTETENVRKQKDVFRDLAELTDDMLVISPRKKINQKDKPGRRMVVETNHLAITFKNQKILAYHYDVTFEPDKPKYLIRSAWNEFARQSFPGRHPSFDGKKNVFSNGALPGGDVSKVIEVYNKENDRNKEFKVTIKLVNKIDLSEVLTYVGRSDERGANYPMIAMQVIDVILRNLPANQLVQSGRLFFSPPQGQIVSLGEGLDMWYGFHQSAILGWKPYLNVDIAHKGFPAPDYLLDFLKKVCGWDGRSDLQRYDLDVLRKYVKRLKVEYQIPGLPSSKRVYKVNDVVSSAERENFTMDNGTRTNVARYYETDKNYRLQYPYLPCLWVGSTAKRILIPIELCKIVPGQVVNGKMSENQTAVMVKEAAKGTDIRKRRIMEQIQKAEYNRSLYANEFGISVAGNFERVEARVLDAPKLEYCNRTDVPRAGVWRPAPFNRPEPLTNWCVICLDQRTREDKLLELEGHLVRTGRELGMNPSDAAQRPLRLDPRADLNKIFVDLSKKGIKIVFVVVPDKGDSYSRVKKISELQVGVLTQCLKATTVFRKLNPSTMNNILLKVNAKLNGVNLKLHASTRPDCFKRPVMIVGADVTHPSPDSTDIPSVAGVAASHDVSGFQYNMIIRLQDPKDEMIRDLENIMKEQLMFFYRRTNQHRPEKIIFFRDGVSDGQINQVFNIEFQAIRRACSSFGAEYKPQITFVIVQKRHHTRFFPTNERDCDDRRNFNVPAGTVVDTDIVHPRETDFYLVSHAAIQGTSRPTKYRLVWDDSDMSETELQKLTYHLCHLFSRCTRSVSYPAPTYNAHLAAFRGRVYLEGERINLLALEQEQRRRTIHQNITQNSPMHFV